MRSTLVLPSSMLPDRVALQRVLGLPCLPDVRSVQNSIDAWHVSQHGIVRDGSSSGEQKPG